MNLEVNDKGIIELKEVYGNISLITNDGEELLICMRDSGFEFGYQGKMYFAKEGYVKPFNTSVRGNYLVDQTYQEEGTVCTNGNPNKHHSILT